MYSTERTQQFFTNKSQANKYHGLINQGATCYLNSVLQVLFMTEDFREAVMRFCNEDPHTTYIDHLLKGLFDDLQNNTACTYKITQKLGPGNVNEQCDAAEYFERVLGMTSPSTSKIFHGLLQNKTTCHHCHIETDTEAPFWHLPLALGDSCSNTRGSEVYSVVNGIEEFFRPSVLCGENQMYCDRCGHKVDATLKDVIKDHPDVLTLVLKRFEFNYNCMSYIKINCFVKVPFTVQIPESETYELYAVVDHFGGLRGGHYTASIKIQDQDHRDRWYEFDDTSVTPADKQMLQEDDTERSKTAYLLFYRKKKVSGIQDCRDEPNSGNLNQDKPRRGTKGNYKNIQKKKDILKKQDDNEGVEYKDKISLYDFGQTVEKLNIAATTHNDVKKQTKKQKNKGTPGKIQTTENSTQRRVTSKGLEKPTVNQQAGCNEKIRAESSQLKARTWNQGVTKRGRGSQKSHPRDEIIEEQIRQASSYENSETKIDHLPTSIENLTLNHQKQGTKRKTKGDERNHSKAFKISKFSEITLEVPRFKHTKKKRNKSKRKEQKHNQQCRQLAKQKKTCISISCISQGSDSN